MSGSTAGVVTFDYAIWLSIYPEFGPGVVGPTQAQQYFDLACLYVSNEPCSPIPVCNRCGSPVRAPILGMVTAHIASLLGQGSTQAVGRIDAATQGSVNVHLDMGQTSQNAAWWQQTKYGAMAWRALGPWRSARFFPAQNPYLGVGTVGWGSVPGAWPSLLGTSYKGSTPWTLP